MVTESEVEIAIAKAGIKIAVEGEAVFSFLSVGYVIKSHEVIQRPALAQQSYYLFSERPVANNADPVHLVATKPRYLKRFRDTGRARCRASLATAARRNNSSRGSAPLF